MDTDGSGIGALDAGAHGILVPLLETADDARKLVQSAKFPPVGKRGFGAPFAMGSIGNVSPIEYLQHANDALITAVQIETKSALDNVCTLYLTNPLWSFDSTQAAKTWIGRRDCPGTWGRCPLGRAMGSWK